MVWAPEWWNVNDFQIKCAQFTSAKILNCKLSLESESHTGALLAAIMKIQDSVIGASLATMVDARDKIESSWNLL